MDFGVDASFDYSAGVGPGTTGTIIGAGIGGGSVPTAASRYAGESGAAATAQAADEEAARYEMSNVFRNRQMASYFLDGPTYKMSAHPAGVRPGAGEMRVGSSLGEMAQGGMTIMGRFVPYWQLGVGGALALVLGYYALKK